MTKNVFARLPLIALAALPLTVGAVMAQQGTAKTTTPQTTPQGTPQRVQPAQPGTQNRGAAPGQPATQQNRNAEPSGTNYASVFLQKLAAQLGISADKLKAAAIAAGGATIDQGVKAGDLPTDRAAEMKARLQTDPFAFGPGGRGLGGRGGHGPGERGGMHGPRGDLPDHGHDAQGNDLPGTEQGTTTPDSSS